MIGLVEVHPCACFIHLALSMHLIGAFNPFTFKVIINMYDPISIFLIVLGLLFVGVFLLLCFLLKEVPLGTLHLL